METYFAKKDRQPLPVLPRLDPRGPVALAVDAPAPPVADHP
jgi:hypothetical protein